MTESPTTNPITSAGTRMKKSVVATAIVASTLGGVAAGAAFFTPVIAGAQDEATEAGPALNRLEAILQPLVDDGTIDEAQRDAVVDTLEAARPEGHGDRGHRGGQRGARLGSIAETLGLDGAEIREALQNGDSIADIAEAQGIDLETVVDSLLAEAEERLDAAVEAGRIDETKAAEMLAEAETKIDDMVNGTFPFEGRRGGFGGRGFGPGPHGDNAPGDTDTAA